MWSVTRRPRVLNLVSAVSVATFGAMCRRERVHVKIGGLRRTSGAIELRARVTRSQRLHDGQCRDEDTAKHHLAQLPGRLQHHAECDGDGTAHRAPSFRLEPNTHIPAAAGVADEVHGSPAAVLCRSICWVLALGPPWRGKKSEEDLRALFSYLTQGRRFAYLESSRSSPWHSTMGWPNP